MILGGGVKRALAERTPVVFNGVRAGSDDQVYRVTIRGIAGRGISTRHVVVSFESSEPADRPAARAPIQIDLDQVSQQQLAALEAELGTTKESLQAAIEQLEASNEELQASNEELQASNEELQSTNEELQSVNEELYTVNAEYQRKIAELTELTNDMDNLLASTDVGTIFLDGQRSGIPQVHAAGQRTSSVCSRRMWAARFETFAHKMRHPKLTEDLKTCSRPGEPDRARPDRSVRQVAFFLRLLPYRAKGAADGVVLTMIDVSGLKAAEDGALPRAVSPQQPLCAAFPTRSISGTRAAVSSGLNHAMAARLGVADPGDAIGKAAFERLGSRDAMAMHREDEPVLRSGQPQHYRLEDLESRGRRRGLGPRHTPATHDRRQHQVA